MGNMYSDRFLFGYAKSEIEKNTVIVNEKEAEIVRHIFSLAEKGLSLFILRLQTISSGPSLYSCVNLLLKMDACWHK